MEPEGGLPLLGQRAPGLPRIAVKLDGPSRSLGELRDAAPARVLAPPNQRIWPSDTSPRLTSFPSQAESMAPEPVNTTSAVAPFMTGLAAVPMRNRPPEAT